MSFFDVLSEVQKDSEGISGGIGNFKKLSKHVVGNLTSELARSTLTLPGTMRVKAAASAH
jgi:hypothetical protein